MVLPARVLKQSEGLIRADCGGLILEAVSEALVGSQVYLCLRPEDLTLSLKESLSKDSARNQFLAVIEQIKSQGPLMRIWLRNQVHLVSLVTRSSSQEMGLSAGLEVFASVKATAIHVIEKSI
jgi:molybdopterin-binding protein